MSKQRKAFLVLCLTLICLAAFGLSANAVAEITYVIPIAGDIDEGNLNFIRNSYAEAVQADAAAIIFQVDTYGGYVDQAITIKDLILSCQIPTYCFVDSKALSAGALIALAGEQMVMTPGASIGAAEPRILDQKADEKTMSMWRSQLSGVAESRGKDGQLAAAMADSDIVIPGVTEKDQLLTLTAAQALEHGLADAICGNLQEVISTYDLPSYTVEAEQSFQDRIGRFLSNPIVTTILLTLGIAGVVIEIVTAGSFGVFGAVGVLGFALYFIGAFFAGNLGWGAVILLAAGIILLLLEIFVIPGFGVPGILGILAILTSLCFVAPNFQHAVISLGIALVLAVIIIVITVKNKKTRQVWSKLILFQKQENAEGYVAPSSDLSRFLGQRGKSLTVLRPAGSAEIAGERVDVVTNGEYIEPNRPILVILVEGLRVVVKEDDPDAAASS